MKWTDEQKRKRAEEKAEREARNPPARVGKFEDKYGICVAFEAGWRHLTVSVRGDPFGPPNEQGWRSTLIGLDEDLVEFANFIYAAEQRYNGAVRDINKIALSVTALDSIAKVPK